MKADPKKNAAVSGSERTKAAKADVVISGGTVVLPSGVRPEGCIVIRGERIAEILSADDPRPAAKLTIDARGKLVLPGIVDAHVHVDTPGPPDKPLGIYSDSFETMSRAAVYGGVTTVIPFIFANGKRDPARYLEDYKTQARRQAWTDFGFHFGIARDIDVEAIPEVVKLGVRSFKGFMAYKRQGNMVTDRLLARAMEEAGRCRGLMMVHAEDGELIDALEERMKNNGDRTPPAYARCRPSAAEHIAIIRALALAKSTDCALYIVHLSTREGLETAKEARGRGQPVVIETCPQYLFLTEAELRPERLGPLAKIGPPLRQSEHGEALWSAVRDGSIDIIASDHAPRLRKDKLIGLRDIFAAPFGSPGLETLLPVVYDEFQKRCLSLTVLARMMSEMPARVFGLYPKKGIIAPGSDADIAIVDPTVAWSVAPEQMQTNAKYSVWEGRNVVGKPVTTLVRGKPVLLDGKACEASGWGKFLADENLPY